MPFSPIGGIIVKRFISLLVALVLLVSIFALPTFALADEDVTTPGTDAEKRVLDFNLEAFKSLVVEKNAGLYVEMSKNFKLNQEWLKSEEDVQSLFGDKINYLVLPDARDDDDIGEEEEKYTVTYDGGEHAAKNTEDGDATETETAITAEYYAGKHVTLKNAATFEAEEGWEFVGWLVPVNYKGTDNKDSVDEYYLYRADDKFVMPAEDITVVAYWYPAETKGDSDSDVAASAEAEAKLEFSYPLNDIICLEYCSPSDEPRDDNWTRVKADDPISLQASGWWLLRYVVVDGTKEISDDEAVITPYNTGEFLEKRTSGEYTWEDFCLYRYAVDTAHPELALSSSMKTKQNEGLTAGTNYTIPTSLTITDSSSTTTTYKVYRHDSASGAGAQDRTSDGWKLIYDSETGVEEGYSDYISAGGVITPLKLDETAEGAYRYMIVYSVKDANGYFGVAEDAEDTNGYFDGDEFHPVLLLGVKLSKTAQQSKERMEAWKIVLYVIAGLSAVGIVVLLCIKPKQAVENDTRFAAVSGSADAKADEVADSSPDNSDDAK